MTQKRLAKRVPPLSSEALAEVLAIEHKAREQVQGCYYYDSFNVNAAIQILRTALVSALDLRIKEYTARQDYNPEWMGQIKDITFHSLMGSIGEIENQQQALMLKTELLLTLNDYATEGTTEHKETQAEPSDASTERARQTLSKQLDELRDECRLTVEQLAEAIAVTPRSVFRHLSGEAEPRKNHIAAYEEYFSKHLKRTVRLITSVKRH